MGAVYLATRIDDFEKEVAVKIIPPLENRQNSAENFRRERQILARLSHKNIAQSFSQDKDKPPTILR